LRAREVAMTSASGVHGPNIAEHALAMMLMFARRLPLYFRHQIAGRWDRAVRGRDDPAIQELGGATLAVVGLGHIGELIAEKARVFGMRVIGVRRDAGRPSSAADRVVGLDRLGDVLAEADHVCLSLPLTPGTRHVIDASKLARMKPTAFLYNVSRGGIVDEPALVEALERRRIAGAGLDVFEQEPLAAASPLWRLDNVILTPHVSGVTPRYFDRFAPILAENLRRWMDGRPLLNQYDPARGY
jgi:phosphoglycerate dehydrogenase-like enzyme